MLCRRASLIILVEAPLLIAQWAEEGTAPRAAQAVGPLAGAAVRGRREGSSGEWGWKYAVVELSTVKNS